MANAIGKKRLHQFTFERQAGVGVEPPTTLLKYYCNGAFVANVVLRAEDFAPERARTEPAVVIGDAFDASGRKWSMDGVIFLVLLHNTCMLPMHVHRMSKELLEDVHEW